MSTTQTMRGRAGGVCVAALPLLILLFATSGVAAAEVLFPAPLHLTREVTTPFADRAQVIEEYGHGNRVVSISGQRTAIADHAKREVTVIDFAAGTYSVTKFEDIANLYDRNLPAAMTTPAAAARQEWRIEARGGRVVASRPGEMMEAVRKNDSGRQVIRLTADRQLKLSRGAAEALLGTGYPYPSNDASEIILGALRSQDRRVSPNGTAAEEYFLPLQYDIVFDVEGQSVETRNVVLRIGNELPPPDLIAVPPGAKLVESDAIAARRNLEELDNPPRRTH